MRSKRSALKLTVALALLTTLLVGPAERALACSCAPSDPIDSLDRSDGAFVGTFTESHPTDPPVDNSGEDTIYTFTVDEPIKGEFGDIAEVHSAFSGASCGLEIPPGEQAGLFLTKDAQGNWNSNLCATIAPDDLRAAAQPRQEPTGNGPPAFIWGGSYGDARVMTLDAEGRVLAYGGGDGDTAHLGVCEGSGSVSEHYYRFDETAFAQVIAMRDLSTMDVSWQTELPSNNRSYVEIHDLACPNNEVVYAYALRYVEGVPSGRLLTITDGHVTKTDFGVSTGGSFVGSDIFALMGERGRRLVKIDPATGTKQFIGKVPRRTNEFEGNADGTAGVAYSPKTGLREAKLVLVRNGKVRVASAQAGDRYVRWWGDKMVLIGRFPDSNSVIYSSTLQKESTLAAAGQPGAISGDRFVTATYGSRYYWTAFRTATLPDGGTEDLMEIVSPISYALEPIP